MVKTEIPKIIAERTGYTQKDVKKVLIALEDLVMETLENNEEVRLFNGLKLFINDRQPIQTRNPITGEKFIADRKFVAKAKFSTNVVNRINKVISEKITED